MISPSGDIKDMTIPWLFQDLRSGKKTGTVILTQDEEVRKVFFKDGDILFASSNQINDRLGEFLLRTGKISQAQFDRSSEIVVKKGKRLGAALLEIGALPAQDLVPQVKLQVKEIVLKVFSWRDGSYRFDEGSLPAAEIVPIHVSTGDLTVEGVRNLDWKVIRKSLPALDTILRPAADPANLFQNAHLDEDQRTIFALIDGGRTIQDLCQLSGIGDFNTLKAIYVLMALRMAEPGVIKTEDEKKFARETMRESEKAAEEVVTKDMIRQAHESMATRDHYDMLDIGRNATVQEIKKAYFRMAKRYHPDRHFDSEMSDMKSTLEALFARVHEAYEVLSSDEARERYNLELVGGARRVQRAAPEQRTEQKHSATMQYEEGLKQFSKENYWGAEEAFQWAMRLDPTNAEYVFRRGYTLARIPRRGNDAEEFLVKAVEMAPKKAEYHLELGNFYARAGQKTKALSCYQNAQKLDPSSERIQAAIKRLSK